MRSLSLTVLVFLFPLAALLAQDVYINPADPAFRAKYKDVDFAGRFSVLAVSDQDNNYYMVDFTKLPTKFEKVYFINLVFKGGKAVNIDSDLSQERVWFLAVKSTKEQSVHDYFLDLKKKTEDAAAAFTAEEQAGWLKKNDKYK
jgi:hypothetical protein